MSKRIVLGLLIVAAAAGIAGAQDARVAIGIDVFPLMKGVIWSDSDSKNTQFAIAPNLEFRAAPHFTIVIGAGLYFGKVADVDAFYVGAAFHGRWYPFSTGFDKLFLDAGLGFNAFSWDGDFDKEKGGMMGLTISLTAGGKLMLTRNIFIEPSMTFIYAKRPTGYGGSFPTPLGWQPGLSIGFAF